MSIHRDCEKAERQKEEGMIASMKTNHKKN